MALARHGILWNISLFQMYDFDMVTDFSMHNMNIVNENVPTRKSIIAKEQLTHENIS